MAFFKNVLGTILKGSPSAARGGESFSFNLPEQVDIAFEYVIWGWIGEDNVRVLNHSVLGMVIHRFRLLIGTHASAHSRSSIHEEVIAEQWDACVQALSHPTPVCCHVVVAYVVCTVVAVVISMQAVLVRDCTQPFPLIPTNTHTQERERQAMLRSFLDKFVNAFNNWQSDDAAFEGEVYGVCVCVCV